MEKREKKEGKMRLETKLKKISRRILVTSVVS